MEGSILECEPNKSAPGALKGDPRAKPKAKRGWPIAWLTVAAGAGFTVLAVTGITSRAASEASLQQATNRSAELTVAVVTPKKAPCYRSDRSAGANPGLYRGAYLRPDYRLPEEMVFRYRFESEGRRCTG